MEDWVRAQRLRVVVLFEGRDAAGQGWRHQADHGRCQSAYLPRGGPRRSERTRAGPVVLPTLRRAAADSRRDRPVRSELVQPGRSGTGHGFCHVPRKSRSSCGRVPNSSGCSSAPGRSSSSTGSRSATTSRSAGSRRASATLRRVGSSARWTSRRALDGSTSRGPRTRCSDTRTPTTHRGGWSNSDDKRRAHLNCITHLLSQVPYEDLPDQELVLPPTPIRQRVRQATEVESAVRASRHGDGVDRRQRLARVESGSLARTEHPP